MLLLTTRDPLKLQRAGILNRDVAHQLAAEP